MTRSSRHKSSKHRDYSDSEKDLISKDRKSSKDDSTGGGSARVSSATEKRKLLDLKGGSGGGNGDYSEELVSSKRRKDRVDDGGSDRWNGSGGGDYDHRGEGSKKAVKGSGDSKSRKRDGSVEMYGVESGEVKKSSSSGKGEGKHRDRDRERDRDKDKGREVEKEKDKEKREDKERERERERDKKSKDGRSERLVSGVVAKHVNENTDINVRKELESPEPENQIERRMRKKRDDSGDRDKHLDYGEDTNGGRLSSKDDLGRESRQKDEKRKDEKYREKFREDMDRDNKHRDDKQREERPTKDHPSSKSDDKPSRDEKDIVDMQQKRSKLQDGDRKGEHDRDRNRDRDSYHVRDRERYHDRERDHGWDHGRERDRDYDRDWDWDRERDGDRDREKNHDRGRDGDRDYDREYDGSHLDDRNQRYKDSSRGKRRSPDDRDDSTDTKSRGVKARYSDLDKKSSSGDRIESDVNKGRSQPRQSYVDTMLSSSKRRTSPSSNSHAGVDDYRYVNPEDSKYRDSVVEHRSKAIPPRDVSGLSGVSERGSKYRSMEKPSKLDDGHLGDPSNEKSSGSKASPMAMTERSPSSSSIDRRYMNRTSVRRSIDMEETGRRSNSSMDNRDFSNTEDRPSRDLPLEKQLVDESSPADSSAHNRSSQSNFPSTFPQHPNFRAGAESPSFTGSVEEEGRVNSGSRYRRSNDPNLVRGHGNVWRGVPGWPSPVNGFMPFPHGAPHGGFQGIMPQFPTAPIFVRPSMDINHYGMPYQIPDERFSGHLRPLGSQNIMDGSGPSHMHIWDGNNGGFRDDSNMYGGDEWDQNRHPMNSRGWDSSAETWKGHNNDIKRDMPSPSPRNDYPLPTRSDDALSGQAGQMSQHEDNLDFGTKTTETRSTVASPLKQAIPTSHEKSPESSKLPVDVPSISHYYLSKLDISAEHAHSELYSQCMNIMDTDDGAAVDENSAMHTILKGATGLKSSKTLLCSSLFPPLKDSVFQKAMDLYKKQRMEARGMSFVAGGRLDIIIASTQKNMESKVCDVEKVQLVLKSDAEMADDPVSSADEENVAIVTAGSVEEKLKELASTPSHEIQNHICLASPKLEMVVDHIHPEEAQTIPNGMEVDSISSEQVKQATDDADGFLLLDKASLATITNLPAIGNDDMSKVKDDSSAVSHSEGVAVDAIRGPSVIPDGSPKACEALMSGSNESDSVILSRIHHSPESTH